MSAKIILMPSSIDRYGLYPMASTLRTRGYHVYDQPGARYVTATAELVVSTPPIRPEPTPRPRAGWWWAKGAR